MIHIFQKGTDPTAPTFLMLHGTGGTERDFIPLAKKLNPEASVISVRGKVLENGKPRFFRRYEDKTFDEADLIFRTEELNNFLNEAAEKYHFDRGNLIALSYSNGSNIAGNLIFTYADALKGAILFHPMVPRHGVNLPDLDKMSVFIGAGRNDPLIPSEEAIELDRLLRKANADVTLHWENSGHYLTGEIFAASKSWYESKYLK